MPGDPKLLNPPEIYQTGSSVSTQDLVSLSKK
jgi:hypothetical protein